MGARLSGASGHAGAAVQQNAEINVTPFVDIMLVLLIIFMVAAPMATVSVRLDLPPAEFPKQPVREPVNVTLQKDGGLYISGRETSLANLAADLCTALGGGACTEERLFVQAQPDASYEQFMTVMNELNAKGFHQVGLINEDFPAR
ncbi:biopolymer transporter ExbD [Brevundimonas sp. Root1279]|uniref:biopolymer transporter ExbD n=1 Tax=Brevundimonas sp. Root1279 TaxID=1736443 RepID=UPI0006FD66BF|nr:biopolymer transporter ExbD [Brevundimonas sp. Root1279]KQW78724.1 biopolymer transporter [Brevundimonas sp. Root1279]